MRRAAVVDGDEVTSEEDAFSVGTFLEALKEEAAGKWRELRGEGGDASVQLRREGRASRKRLHLTSALTCARCSSVYHYSTVARAASAGFFGDSGLVMEEGGSGAHALDVPGVAATDVITEMARVYGLRRG